MNEDGRRGPLRLRPHRQLLRRARIRLFTHPSSIVSRHGLIMVYGEGCEEGFGTEEKQRRQGNHWLSLGGWLILLIVILDGVVWRRSWD